MSDAAVIPTDLPAPAPQGNAVLPPPPASAGAGVVPAAGRAEVALPAGFRMAPASGPTPGRGVGLVPACGGDTSCGCGCGGAGKSAPAPPAFVFALGSVRATFPSMSLEQEFRSVARLGVNTPISSPEIFRVLSQAENVYIAREMCWVFIVANVDVYLVTPRTYVELSELIMALQPNPTQVTQTLVVGTLGPVAPPDFCNGMQLPVTAASQVFHFTNQALIDSIVAHSREQDPANPVDPEAVRQVLNVLLQLTDNTGQTDEFRAINYVMIRSLDLYITATRLLHPTDAQGNPLPPYQLASVSAQISQLSGARRIVDVIFIFNNTVSNAVQRYFARVDVTGMFPFMMTPLQQYFDHP